MEENRKIDNKIVKNHYPRTNKDNILEIIFDRDPNLCLLKNNIKIGFQIKVPHL